MYWDPLTNGTLLSTDSRNWCIENIPQTMRRATSADTPTSPGEHLVFGAYIPDTYLYQYPQQIFIPAHWSTADCILTQESQYTTNGVANYLGLTMLSTYPGEITLTQSASITSLDVRSGKIKQNDTMSLANGSAGTITVMQSLNWIGGTINSNTVAGTLSLKGVHDGVIGTDTSTVTSGSKIVLEEGYVTGTNVTVRGTLNMLNTMGIEVLIHCTLLLHGNANGNQKLNMQPGAVVLTKGNTWSNGNETTGAYVLDGGNLMVWSGGMKVTGQVDPNSITSPSVLVLHLHSVLGILNRETLTVSHGVELKGGSLYTYTANTEDQQVAYINGTLQSESDNSYINLGLANFNLAASYSKLHVWKEVILHKGQFWADLNANDVGAVERVLSESFMMFSSSYIVAPRPSSLPLGQGLKWIVMFAQGDFVDSANPSLLGAGLGPGVNGMFLARNVPGKSIEVW